MEELKAKLQLEANRREVFERKNAELEAINDELKLENRKLLSEVEALKKRISILESVEDDQSDSSDEGKHDYEEVDLLKSAEDKGNMLSNANSDLSLNTNHSNGNEGGGGGGGGKDVKIMTLKRKQKALKAELEETLCKTVGFQEAFQTEMDLRTKIEEKYESLHVRYERLVVENDNFRKVLANHCIDVPPHQPITKRPPRHAGHHHASLHPPSFVPPGRPKSHRSSSSRASSRTGGANSSPSHSVSSHSSTSSHSPLDPDVTTPPATLTFEVSPSPAKTPSEAEDRLSLDGAKSPLHRSMPLNGNTALNGSGVTGKHHSLPQGAVLLDSDEEEEEEEEEVGGEGVEHIIVEPHPVLPTSLTQDIDDALATTADQIANAKAFYQHIRQKMQQAEDSDS